MNAKPLRSDLIGYFSFKLFFSLEFFNLLKLIDLFLVYIYYSKRFYLKLCEIIKLSTK